MVIVLLELHQMKIKIQYDNIKEYTVEKWFEKYKEEIKIILLNLNKIKMIMKNLKICMIMQINGWNLFIN